MLITLQDNTPQHCTDGNEIRETVRQLKQTYAKGDIKLVRLRAYGRPDPQPPSPLEPGFDFSKGSTGLILYPNNYVGQFCHKDHTIEIAPRFGKAILPHMLFAAANIYLPDAVARTLYENSEFPLLLHLLWGEMLRKCIGETSLPRAYIAHSKNLAHVRGRIDFSKDSRINTVDKSRIFCNYRELSADNLINRAIVNILQIIMESGTSPGYYLQDLADWHDTLLALGVREENVRPEDIDRIRYTLMSEPYRPLMELGKHILQRKSSIQSSSAQDKSLSFFIDIAEVWELYLLSVLRKRLNSQYSVYSPNSSGNVNWLKMGRKIRPDIIIERAGQPVMIIDAKYKEYNHIGSTTQSGIYQEDLFQLTSYMHHYGSNQKPIAGVISSPVYGHEESKFCNNEHHKIALVNLDVQQFDQDQGQKYDINNLKESVSKAEQKYVEEIEQIIEA